MQIEKVCFKFTNNDEVEDYYFCIMDDGKEQELNENDPILRQFIDKNFDNLNNLGVI
jgi:hypothetical protein